MPALWPQGRPAASGAACGGLAHRRLSIFDLSPAGRQPMANGDLSLWIICNGESYTFGDYRAELERQGHVFCSRCYTETVLHLFEQHGLPEALRRMNGMFAFALWDVARGRLWLACDRLGKKPLYYAQPAPGEFLFASELPALLASGRIDASRLDAVAMDQIWTMGDASEGRTVYAQVVQLSPGCLTRGPGTAPGIRRPRRLPVPGARSGSGGPA